MTHQDIGNYETLRINKEFMHSYFNKYLLDSYNMAGAYVVSRGE